MESIAADYIHDCNPVEKADSCDIQLVLEVNSTDTDCDHELSGIGQNIMLSDSSTIKEHYLTNLGLFYLKLQSKLFLPPTVQQITDEFQEVHNVGKEYHAHQLTTLQGLLINEQQFKDLLKKV